MPRCVATITVTFTRPTEEIGLRAAQRLVSGLAGTGQTAELTSLTLDHSYEREAPPAITADMQRIMDEFPAYVADPAAARDYLVAQPAAAAFYAVKALCHGGFAPVFMALSADPGFRGCYLEIARRVWAQEAATSTTP